MGHGEINKRSEGAMETGTGAAGLQDLEQSTEDIELTGEEGLDVLEPEDITQEILNESVEETTRRVSKALKEESATTNEQPAGIKGATQPGATRGPDGRFLPKSANAADQQPQQVAQPTASQAPQRFS